jgi:hypothetical protein
VLGEILAGLLLAFGLVFLLPATSRLPTAALPPWSYTLGVAYSGDRAYAASPRQSP